MADNMADMMSEETARQIRGLERDRAELAAKYAAMHQALDEVGKRYRHHVPGVIPDHSFSTACAKCGADDVISTVLEAVYAAFPDNTYGPFVPRA